MELNLLKTRAIIMAGGEGSRLGILTAKRTKPAVPFAGKYRIIDFTLSNCVNSGVFDVMILAQYRPHSLIEHIGAGGPWDLNRDFTGGARIYTPYKARGSSDWYLGTADAVQQNFLFIKRGQADLVLILSGDHIYNMNYAEMIEFHRQKGADVTIASISVPLSEANRFGILGVDPDGRVNAFVEKPMAPPSDLANMGVYLFNMDVLDKMLWEDHQDSHSSHDFGKDILPRMVNQGMSIYAYPFSGYWVDVGTISSYWSAHMDLLVEPPPIDLNNRRWIIHTRTEERPPVRIARDAQIVDSMISDGCVISSGVVIERSVLSPGITVHPGAVIRESVIMTDTEIGPQAVVEYSILDKKVKIGAGVRIGGPVAGEQLITTIGKHADIPAGMVIEPGAIIGPDVFSGDFSSNIVHSEDYIQTRRLPNEI
jgi:glucose-1-phosphate adenylyltransferase